MQPPYLDTSSGIVQRISVATGRMMLHFAICFDAVNMPQNARRRQRLTLDSWLILVYCVHMHANTIVHPHAKPSEQTLTPRKCTIELTFAHARAGWSTPALHLLHTCSTHTWQHHLWVHASLRACMSEMCRPTWLEVVPGQCARGEHPRPGAAWTTPASPRRSWPRWAIPGSGRAPKPATTANRSHNICSTADRCGGAW